MSSAIKREYHKRWRENNRPKLAEYNRRYYEENKAQRNESCRRYYEENKDKILARQRQRRKENPETQRAHVRKRRARRRSATVGDPNALRKREAEIQKEPCMHCGGHARIEVDHIVPLSKGGAHAADNLQPLCRSCNAKKGVAI